MKLVQTGEPLSRAALKTGMNEKTARKYRAAAKLPGELQMPHTWRTRPDPFEATWSRVRAWLEAEPDSIGKTLFARLQAEHAGVFPDGQLRTFQRRVKEWRHAAARRLVFASSSDAA